jgi:hypothetical protein
MRFEVLMAVKKLMVVFWVKTLCGLIGGYHCCEGIYCLHLQGRLEDGDNMFL